MLVTENDSGKSVTNAAEELAEQICQYYEIPQAQLKLIEHYPTNTFMGEEFSLVSFSFRGSRLTHPRWTHISKAHAVGPFGMDFNE